MRGKSSPYPIKRVKRTQTRGRERESRESSTRLGGEGNESRGHVKSSSTKGNVVIDRWEFT